MKKYDMTEKMRSLHHKFSYIQRKMIDKIVTRDSKIEVLFIYWDKIISSIIMRASKLNDDKAKLLAR